MARVGIRDVAARAGVSPTAVSFAMNGSGSLSEETRARILEAANELGYRPNQAARSLKSGWTKTIALQISGQNHGGMVHRDALSPFQVELLNAASTAALKMGNLLVVIPESAAKVMDVRGLPLDALVLIDPTGRQPLAEAIRSEGKPVVSIGRPSGRARLADVVVDNDFGAIMDSAVRHLLSSGYERPAYVAGGGRGQATYRRDLRQAFRSACKRHGAGVTVRDLADESYESARNEITRILTSRTESIPDSFITFGDDTALAALGAASDLGLRVPQDLGVLSLATSVTLAFQLARPALTRVETHGDQQGKQAVEAAIALVNGTDAPPERVTTDHTLIPRGSTDKFGHLATP